MVSLLAGVHMFLISPQGLLNIPQLSAIFPSLSHFNRKTTLNQSACCVGVFQRPLTPTFLQTRRDMNGRGVCVCVSQILGGVYTTSKQHKRTPLEKYLPTGIQHWDVCLQTKQNSPSKQITIQRHIPRRAEKYI